MELSGLFLRADCVKHIDRIADNALQNVDRIRDRCVHAAKQLGNEFLAGRQSCESFDLVDADDLAFDHTDFDRQYLSILELVLLDEAADDLCRSNSILRGECESRRALEVLFDALDACLLAAMRSIVFFTT